MARCVLRDHERCRVLIIVQNLPVPFDRRVWLESQALVASGFAVTVICPTGERATARSEQLEGVDILRYPAPRPAHGLAGYVSEFLYCWLWSAWLAVGEYRRHRFDCIQACNPPDTFWLLAALFKPLGVRFVYDQHDLCPEVYQSRFADARRGLVRALRLLERASYAMADRVISTNESYREKALTRGRVPPDRVTVVRNGPDPAKMFRRAPDPELKRERRHLCCYLGVMGPQDGVDVLVTVIERYVRHLGRDDCQFALLGFGDCLEDLRRQVSGLGLDDWVVFTGRADDAMISAYLSTADLGLSPDPLSPLNDVSTHNKTMEYMAYGLPVVAFDLKETRVSGQGAAVYVTPNDPEEFARTVAELLDDPTRRSTMGAVARARVEDVLAWGLQKQRYVALYEDLLGPAPALD